MPSPYPQYQPAFTPEELAKAYDNAIAVHLPIHASLGLTRLKSFLVLR